MKGIILAGGRATRLQPITKVVCKQLLPVYDKPMIYYPLSILMLANIRDILIISSPNEIEHFKYLLGDGGQLGLNFSYASQSEPNGVAESFIIGNKFIGQDSVCLILGDNILYGDNLKAILQAATALKEGALIFAYYVKDPERYGVVEIDNEMKAISIEEKPIKPKSNWAVTGLYFYDNSVIDIAASLSPSKRGELEITDINRAYLKQKMLEVKLLGRGYAWLDTGTPDSLIDASVFIKTIEERQGLKIGCIEEIAFALGYIDRDQLKFLANSVNCEYRNYLMSL
ncbi:glucose-1-phosphate thymidylyltransferase RfbA [Thermoproteota archaeon]